MPTLTAAERESLAASLYPRLCKYARRCASIDNADDAIEYVGLALAQALDQYTYRGTLDHADLWRWCVRFWIRRNADGLRSEYGRSGTARHTARSHRCPIESWDGTYSDEVTPLERDEATHATLRQIDLLPPGPQRWTALHLVAGQDARMAARLAGTTASRLMREAE